MGEVSVPSSPPTYIPPQWLGTSYVNPFLLKSATVRTPGSTNRAYTRHTYSAFLAPPPFPVCQHLLADHCCVRGSSARTALTRTAKSRSSLPLRGRNTSSGKARTRADTHENQKNLRRSPPPPPGSKTPPPPPLPSHLKIFFFGAFGTAPMYCVFLRVMFRV